MKVLSIKDIKWSDCIKKAQTEGIVLTQDGKPVVLMVGVAGLDLEQIELGQSDQLWNLLEKRRQQKPISRSELERRLLKRGTKQKVHSR